MHLQKIKKYTIYIFLCFSMVFGHTAAVIAANMNVNKSLWVANSDTTKVKNTKPTPIIADEPADNTEKASSVTKISYNIIYFLIAKFLMLNPFRRPA